MKTKIRVSYTLNNIVGDDLTTHAMSQCIGCHRIDVVLPEYSGLWTIRVINVISTRRLHMCKVRNHSSSFDIWEAAMSYISGDNPRPPIIINNIRGLQHIRDDGVTCWNNRHRIISYESLYFSEVDMQLYCRYRIVVCYYSPNVLWITVLNKKKWKQILVQNISTTHYVGLWCLSSTLSYLYYIIAKFLIACF